MYWGRSLSAPVGFGLQVAADADDKIGFAERKIIDAKIEPLAVGVGPEGADGLPEFLLAGFGDDVETVRRARFAGFGIHRSVLSIVSPPQWRPRCPFQGRGGKAGLSQAVRRTPNGAELHKRRAEASGFDCARAPRQNWAKERTRWRAGICERHSIESGISARYNGWKQGERKGEFKSQVEG